MSNETQAAGAGAQHQQPPSLMVNAQYVRDLSFENPNAPGSLRPQEQAPTVDINVDVQAKGLAENTYEVVLTIGAQAKLHDGAVGFVVELTYAGVFTLKGTVPQEMVEPILFAEAPRMLFPFARAIVSEASRDGGFPPLMVHPVDFLQLYQQRRRAGQPGEEGRKGGNGAADAGN